MREVACHSSLLFVGILPYLQSQGEQGDNNVKTNSIGIRYIEGLIDCEGCNEER